MIAISLRFLAGRYHATPWGRHVNEGAVEWPPSPWRILRALVAAWKRTLPDLSQDQVEPVLLKLSTPPEFVLPPVSTGHTRHFMPWFKKGPEDRTLVFDTFIAVPRDAHVIIRWPDASLDDSQREILARILDNLATLGRSESWCEAALAGGQPESGGMMCRPLHEQLPADHDIARVLCPDAVSAFADDHVAALMTKTTGRTKNRHVAEQRSTIFEPAWDFCMDTLQLHREKWSDPPGSRWIAYARPCGCFRIEPAARSHRIRTHIGAGIQVARYALDSTVLPLVTDTLPVAEAARRALMSLHGQFTERNGVRGRSPLFSGKDDQSKPLAGHRHAYYLPSDEDGDGRLDHLTIVARNCFTTDECRAFDRLRKIKIGHEVEERQELQVLLLDMARLDENSPGRLERAATAWESATPYIATRYAKTRGRHRRDLRSANDQTEFLFDDLREQIRQVLGIDPTTVYVEAIADEHGAFKVGRRWRPIQFKRYRSKRSDDGGRRLAGAFRIRFDRPVSGPIALGHSSHFGLGLFVPVGRA